VDFGGMAAGQQDFVLAYRGLQETLEDLERKLESRLAQWEGSARGEYQNAKAQWNQAAQEMAVVLNSLGGVIGTGHENYSGAERSGMSIWNG
jgi:WXG100 family type VII secretion target